MSVKEIEKIRKNITNVELEFIHTVRTAPVEDVKKMTEIIKAGEGYEDKNGELTDLGLLAGAIEEILFISGILKKMVSNE